MKRRQVRGQLGPEEGTAPLSHGDRRGPRDEATPGSARLGKAREHRPGVQTSRRLPRGVPEETAGQARARIHLPKLSPKPESRELLYGDTNPLDSQKVEKLK